MTVHTTPDPEAFRRVVGGKRHYVLGDGPPVPSATSIKPEKTFWSATPLGTRAPLDAIRCAEWTVENRDRIGDIDPDLLVEEIAGAPKAALNVAAQRGTNVHDALSEHILGQTPRDLAPDEHAYFKAGLAFIDDYQPEWIATEVIVDVPELDVAGTTDWIARIAGKVIVGDWKTRGKRHGAYPEEAAQLGVYSFATAMIVGDHPGTRVALPEIDELAVVSLSLDGSYALFPIDVVAARSAATHMRQAWAGQQLVAQVGQQAIGTPVIAAPVQQTLDDTSLADRVAWLRARLGALTPAAKAEASKTWPAHAPRKAAAICSDTEIDAIAACLDRVEAAHDIPFGPSDPAAPPPAAGAARRKVSPTRA